MKENTVPEVIAFLRKKARGGNTKEKASIRAAIAQLQQGESRRAVEELEIYFSRSRSQFEEWIEELTYQQCMRRNG